MVSVSKLFLTTISAVAAISGVTTTLFIINNLKSGKNYDSAISYIKDKANLIKKQISEFENYENIWKNEIYKFSIGNWNCKSNICAKKVSKILNNSSIFINNYEKEISNLQVELKKLNNFLEK